MTESTVEYTYTLGFRNPEFEDYTDLASETEVIQALRAEVEKSIVDLGSDGYDPSHVLEAVGIKYDQDLDPDDELGSAAHGFAVQTATQRELEHVWCQLSGVVAGTDIELSAELPGGAHIFLREDEER